MSSEGVRSFLDKEYCGDYLRNPLVHRNYPPVEYMGFVIPHEAASGSWCCRGPGRWEEGVQDIQGSMCAPGLLIDEVFPFDCPPFFMYVSSVGESVNSNQVVFSH